jgi:hypothetical protein
LSEEEWTNVTDVFRELFEVRITEKSFFTSRL